MSDLIQLKESAKDLSVLIVEDSLTIQKQMKLFLEKLFKKVFIANDGVEALDIYKEFQADIILTDIQMPNMDGAELIESLNKLDSKSKIIVFSAYGHSENVMKFLRMGVCDFIQKPVNFQQLITTLLKVVSMSDCVEKEFDNELLKDLDIIKNSKAPITLVNHYKGLPLIHDGIITSIENNSIKIQTQNVQTKAILEEKSTTIETDKAIINVKLKDYDLSTNELIFTDLEKLERSPRNREALRIMPEKEFVATIFHQNERYNFNTNSLSTKAISFKIKQFDEKIKLEDKVNLSLGFNTFYTTAYHNTVTHKERIDTKASVLKIEKTNNFTKLVMGFELNLADKKVLEKYIYQREVDIIKEFKKKTFQ
ncbi:MAG: response regulator [Arcobacter sp.]|uniref:response regulator n=1 Tax=Arcobacter sp. TaxID=1872629 RepID=UPI003AFFF9DB